MHLYSARIAAIHQETPSIKSFWLELGHQDYHFLAGQWIDLHVEIDGAVEVGGYSITSSPLTQGRIQLAVKQGQRHPVTRYLYEQAKLGDSVRVSVGQGQFFFERGQSSEIALLGAGVGVTPMISIIRYAAELAPETRVTLVYSMTEPAEYLFRSELEALAASHAHLRLVPTVTQRADGWSGRTGRMDRALLESLQFSPATLFYLCGPPAMVDEQATVLEGMHIPPERLIYEKWW